MIKLENINLHFGNKEIFSDFSLTIKKGEKILLNAPSGKGKSSLLKIIMGFLKPDSGQVIIADKVLSAQNVKEIRGKIAYLPQDISFPKMKVEDFIQNVLAYESNKNISYKRDSVEGMLKDLILPKDTLTQDTSSLSGGEKQRIGILIMQLLNREIFLLDEVTSALNSELKEFITNYFLKMKQTIIVVSHDEVWQEKELGKVVW